MSRTKYTLNPETLLYEIREVSVRHKVIRGLLWFAGTVALTVFYCWLATSVFGLDLPKTALLKAENARWEARMDVLNSRLDRYEDALDELKVRDEDVYRSIFGMNSIPDDVRNVGTGGIDKYSYLDGLGDNNRLKSTVRRLDNISRRTYFQSSSFDEVAVVSKRADEMASCIPAIPPIVPDKTKYNLSSTFGYRTDPFNGSTKMHTGVDLAMKIGNPVYATGDGVVESVDFEFFGYGNSITIDHGFGYKTKYAHLNSVNVREGMKVHRGDCIAETGKSGRSSGPHLHYEVIYKGSKVNPMNYFDLSMPKEEYLDMVSKREEESGTVSPKHGFSVRRR